MKKLIISPHVDDEVIACGGILDKDSFVYYCGVDESLVVSDPGHRIPTDERLKELVATADYLDFKYEVNKENKVNFFVEQKVKDQLEEVINRTRPEMIFLPHPGYNQDHRMVYDAAQIALRPHDKNFFVKKVLVYEAIHDFLWSDRKFYPNYFVPIDIERKLRAYNLQKSQVRGFRSPEMIGSLAKLRGAQSNRAAAEAFQILRWVE